MGTMRNSVLWAWSILVLVVTVVNGWSLWGEGSKSYQPHPHVPITPQNYHQLLPRSSSSSSGGGGWGWGWPSHGHHGGGGDGNMDLYSLLGGLSFASLLGATIIYLARRNTSGRRRRSLINGKEYYSDDDSDDDFQVGGVHRWGDVLQYALGNDFHGGENDKAFVLSDQGNGKLS